MSPLNSDSAAKSTEGAGSTSCSAKQTILFLQGHPSFFARNLAGALEAADCRVLRINFCFGDWAYWLGRRAVNYRGRFDQWEKYLQAFVAREGVTDIIYYGDCKPYHLVASSVAKQLGIRALTYEFGYLRPDWITLEQFGMSTRSHFPDNPEKIRAIGSKFQAPDMRPCFPYSMISELTHEIFYNLSSYFMTPFFFNYHSDRYYNPLVEYLTGLPKQFTASANNRRADALINGLIESETSFYLYALQLQNDYQLRHHAAFPHQSDAIEAAIGSFAANAPLDTQLIFKCHPLDNGGESWASKITEVAQHLGVINRTHYVEGGNLNRMLTHARGCVLINSTVGMHAISVGCPVKVLGGAIFDIAGLTHQGSLGSFWRHGEAPDEDFVDAFVRALAGTIQVKGNFFTVEGQAAAIPVFVERLIHRQVNGAGAFTDPPPRISDAGRIRV